MKAKILAWPGRIGSSQRSTMRPHLEADDCLPGLPSLELWGTIIGSDRKRIHRVNHPHNTHFDHRDRLVALPNDGIATP
jgi:hypothetical protein